MIVRRIGDTILADCEAVSVDNGRRPVATIRKHCVPVATDTETGRALYDAMAAKAVLAAVPQRAAHRRERRT